MKITKTANSLQINLSQSEWFDMGKKAGWLDPHEETTKEADKKGKKGRCWKRQ